jgi:ElaB/YqjD/DUF883 family membrane-anchored ribosome-binding protein
MATENNPIPTMAGPTEADFAGTTPIGTAGTTPTSTRPELMRRVVDGAHATIDRLAETAEPVVTRLTDGMGGTAGSLQERADHLREVGDEWAENLRGSVRQHPMTAVAIALGVGLLIARLSR